MLVFPFIVVLCIISISIEAAYNTQAWQSLSSYPGTDDFPELNLLKNKPNTAIAFTGGGSRAYVASLGYIAGLQKLDLLKKVRYIGGISGGSWATLTFTYAQNAPDDILLGEIVPPEQLTPANLKLMEPKCARAFAAAGVEALSVKAYLNGSGDSVAGSWVYAISKTYLEPAGIVRGKLFSWNAESVNDIVKRNSNLDAEDFQLPVNPDRPFPVIGTTLVGPQEGAPYKKDSQNYTLIEITPLYIGQMKTIDVEYHVDKRRSYSKRVGGAIEPFGFSVEGSAPSVGLSSNQKNSQLSVPEPKVPFDLAWAAGASSYAPGSLVESLPLKIYEMGMHINYWSPAESVIKPGDTLFADGGAVENIPLISFMQRRVRKIILFYVSSTPLAPASKYDPLKDKYTGDQLTDALSTFFGVFDPDYANWEDRSLQYERNQVFATSDYAPVVAALQASQANGKGIFATFNLTTVENSWWGIPAGLTFEITFSYLGRLKAWESKLSAEMYPLLVPKDNADDLSHDVEKGDFKDFPHYGTRGGDIEAARANVLADLTGWSVLENADYFRRILS